MLQSIIFDKQLYSLREAKHWLLMHHYKPIKPVHSTTNFYRFRMSEPNPRNRYYTKHITDGIMFIFD